MAAVHFKDFGKNANDLLNDDYDFFRKIKVVTKTAEGVQFTTEGNMTGDGSSKAILGKISASFKHAQTGINFKKLQFTTHGRFIGEAEIADVGAKGVKLVFKAEDGSTKNSANKRYAASGKIGLDYVSGPIAASTEADLVNSKLVTSAVYGYERFLIGAGASVDTDKSALSDVNVGVGYHGLDYRVAVKTASSMNVVIASYDHRLSPDLHAAARISHNIAKQTQVLSVGGKYAPDLDTVLKGKVDTEGIVSLAIISKVSKNTKLSLATEIDAKNLEGDSHKFGIGIVLG